MPFFLVFQGFQVCFPQPCDHIIANALFRFRNAHKLFSNYFEFPRTDIYPQIRIHYNIDYKQESYSKHFDPDISIEIFDKDDSLKSIYVFDSKFKAISTKGSEYDGKTYNFDDITKMHAYKDAIVLAKGAYMRYLLSGSNSAKSHLE